MAFSQLNKTMANLRMSLAEITDKERQLDSMISQFRTQLRRLPRQVIYGRTSLDSSLTAMGEIEERLADSVDNRRRLLAIKKTATEELEALAELCDRDRTARVQEARVFDHERAGAIDGTVEGRDGADGAVEGHGGAAGEHSAVGDAEVASVDVDG